MITQMFYEMARNKIKNMRKITKLKNLLKNN